VLAVSIAGLPLAPPEHAHEAEEHGQEHLLVHRHLEAHSKVPDFDHEGVADPDDDSAFALDAVHAVPSSFTILAVPTVATFALVEPPAVVLLSAQGKFEPLIHGPPRAPNGTRAPPRLSCL
jgi:hypothetical protein